MQNAHHQLESAGFLSPEEVDALFPIRCWKLRDRRSYTDCFEFHSPVVPGLIASVELYASGDLFTDGLDEYFGFEVRGPAALCCLPRDSSDREEVVDVIANVVRHNVVKEMAF